MVQLLSVADTPHHFSLQFNPCLGGNLYQLIQRQECCDETKLCRQVWPNYVDRASVADGSDKLVTTDVVQFQLYRSNAAMWPPGEHSFSVI